mmetsp:Transcript_102455/g.141670  ORF Transcript_102455/g.141670 Transcript_102455/m.141670 type:complete len:138 (+) Transcript_102455:320-733(+)
MSACLFLGVWILQCRKHKYGFLARSVTFILVIVPVMLVAASRAYNGAHSYNQLISGFIQGVLCFYLFYFAIYDALLDHLTQIKKNGSIIFNRVFMTINLLLAIYFGVYFYNDQIIDPEWKKNILATCGEEVVRKFKP